MKSCKEVSKLVSQALDRRLTLRERLTVKMHLLICKMCCHYQQQIKFIAAASRKFLQQDADKLQLSDEARSRIQEILKHTRPTGKDNP